MLYLASLDDVTETGQSLFGKLVSDAPSAEEVMEELDEEEIRARRLNEIVATLTVDEQYVIRGVFGFGGQEPRTMRAIATDLGLGEYRVSAIRDEAMNRISIRATIQPNGAVFGAAR